LNDDEHFSVAEGSNYNMVEVATGGLCLFPSSLYHYTTPFDGQERRIVLAFDVIPKT
jgi:hypothetical protein